LEQTDKIFLNPGDIYIADNPATVWTVLGSCLGIVFYSRRLKIGALAHAQLPAESHAELQCRDNCMVICLNDTLSTNPFKYVSCSIRYMVDYFGQLGVFAHEIDVKLFGGAHVLPGIPMAKTVGRMNIEAAHAIIAKFRLNLLSEHVGGDRGRVLYFDSATGDVWLKQHRTKQEIYHPALLSDPELPPLVIQGQQPFDTLPLATEILVNHEVNVSA